MRWLHRTLWQSGQSLGSSRDSGSSPPPQNQVDECVPSIGGDFPLSRPVLGLGSGKEQAIAGHGLTLRGVIFLFLESFYTKAPLMKSWWQSWRNLTSMISNRSLMTTLPKQSNNHPPNPNELLTWSHPRWQFFGHFWSRCATNLFNVFIKLLNGKRCN